MMLDLSACGFEHDLAANTAEDISKAKSCRTIGIRQIDENHVDRGNAGATRGLIESIAQKGRFRSVDRCQWRSLPCSVVTFPMRMRLE